MVPVDCSYKLVMPPSGHPSSYLGMIVQLSSYLLHLLLVTCTNRVVTQWVHTHHESASLLLESTPKNRLISHKFIQHKTSVQ